MINLQCHKKVEGVFIWIDLHLQIFDRKNNEIENLRTEGRIKQSQLEAQVKRLEIKLGQLAKENKLLRHEGNQSVVDSREHRQRLEAQFDEKVWYLKCQYLSCTCVL